MNLDIYWYLDCLPSNIKFWSSHGDVPYIKILESYENEAKIVLKVPKIISELKPVAITNFWFYH